MYYHCRPLKFVEYGKIFPPPADKVDDHMVTSYRWLGHYCGFYPQVWLSRSVHEITGFKSQCSREREDILFAFDILPGAFPLSYQPWEDILGMLINLKDNASLASMNKCIQESFEWLEKECKIEKWEPSGTLQDWIDCGRDLDAYLKKHVFVEFSQVVVPSLNLKVAKQIICRDEKQKKVLRKMGFIEDRILIKNIKTRKY